VSQFVIPAKSRVAEFEPETSDLLQKARIPDHARLRRAVRKCVFCELRLSLGSGNMELYCIIIVDLEVLAEMTDWNISRLFTTSSHSAAAQVA
jgi:hypothetical protein